MVKGRLSNIPYKNLLTNNPNFRNLWISRTISGFGDALYSVALMWIVYSETGSALQSGMVLVAQFLPEMILGLVFGVWVDRWNRKLLMQISDAVQALVTGILAVLLFTDQFHMMYVYIITVILSLSATLFNTANNAWLPDVVEQKDLMAAYSLLSSSRQIATLSGSLLGGALLAIVGSAASVAIDAGTFVVSLLFVQLMKYTPFEHQKDTSKKPNSMWSDISDSFRWLRGQHVLMLLILLGTIANVALGPTNVLPAMLVQAEFHSDARALGVFDASIALGVLVGGLVIGALSPKRTGLWYAWGLGLQGVAMALVSLSPTIWMAYAANFILGLAVIVTGIPMSALFQSLIPSEMRGRVNSLSSIMFNLSIPITYGAIGALADVIGVRTCYAFGGLILLAAMLAGLLNSTLRKSGLSKGEDKLESGHVSPSN